MKSLWYWRLAIMRVLIYGSIVAWGVFKAGVEGYERWIDMTAMQHHKLYGDMGIAFGGVLLAFLDQSLQRLTAEKPEYDRQEAVKEAAKEEVKVKLL